MRTVRHSKIALMLTILSAFTGITFAFPAAALNSLDPATESNHIHLSRLHAENKGSGLLIQTKLYPVTRGDWGGQSLSFVVEKSSVKIDFDCAEGRIPSQLKADKKGKFKVEGTLTPHKPGPVRRDQVIEPMAAIYEGTVKRKIMTLKVTLVKTNESAGEFTIERGKTPNLTRCY